MSSDNFLYANKQEKFLIFPIHRLPSYSLSRVKVIHTSQSTFAMLLKFSSYNFSLSHHFTCFLLQDLCLPLYCPTNRLKINGRCVSMITKLITRAIALLIEADIQDNTALISKQKLETGDMNMLRSTCLDFKWTDFGLFALNGTDSNITHALRLRLMKIYAPEKELRFLQLLSRIHKCIQSPWEIRLNGQWLSVNFTFPSVQPYGREDPTMNILAELSSRPYTIKDVPYVITKLDFCQQVSL